MSARDDFPATVHLEWQEHDVNPEMLICRADWSAACDEIDSLRAQLAQKIDTYPALLAEVETLRVQVQLAEIDADALAHHLRWTLDHSEYGITTTDRMAATLGLQRHNQRIGAQS